MLPMIAALAISGSDTGVVVEFVASGNSTEANWFDAISDEDVLAIFEVEEQAIMPERRMIDTFFIS